MLPEFSSLLDQSEGQTVANQPMPIHAESSNSILPAPSHTMQNCAKSGIHKPNPNTADPSLFINHLAHGTLVLLLYVDDIILTGSSDKLINQFIVVLHTEFAIKDLGALHYFLGIEVSHVSNGLVLHQSKYAIDLLNHALMRDCKPVHTPMTQKFKTITDSTTLCDTHNYRSLVGALQYLTLTRPDISFSVNYVSQFTHAPTQDHFTMVRRILRYVKGTVHHGLHFQNSSTLDLYAFSDVDLVGCPHTRRSTTGFCTYLGSNIISWSAKKQPTVSRSSSEAEYRAMAQTAAEITWLTFILRDLQVPLMTPPVLFCDNLSSLFMTVNPMFHARSKHIELDYHYIRERVSLGLLTTRHISTSAQIADVFTKPQTRYDLDKLKHKLCLVTTPSLRADDNIHHLINNIPDMETVDMERSMTDMDAESMAG
ncbi:uncharacterized protein LOC116133454 [Pistacia vera]|uniref:uncharacterized protein LOC116133454 n=1 Tax=Pistacia vera TaxID=55513 RepID=UPI001263DB66|nr:uncharacterized protein LOC116133454 [Pistacia vera]